MLTYRLGLDLGANSIGWCVLELDENNRPIDILRSGVRIFKDGRNPKDKTSLAVARRLARQMRRRRDRYLKRRTRLVDILQANGLFPKDHDEGQGLELLDPYELRARGLDAALTPHELGRALFHINQRRGFKSNRKTTPGDDEDPGVIKASISKTRDMISEAGCRTLGEYLHQRRLAGQPVRARRRAEFKDYELYFDRDMTESEVNALLDSQAPHHPAILTPECRFEILDTILFQRELRPVDPGKCTFEPSDNRAPLALPSVQAFRIYQELNNLRIIESHLTTRAPTLEERDEGAELLLQKPKVTFAGLRRAMGLHRDTKFNLESDRRKDLKGCETGSRLFKVLGQQWMDLSLGERDGLVELLLAAPDDEALVAELKGRFALDDETAWKVAEQKLPDGYGRLGRFATGKILQHLIEDVVTYSTACELAGYNHSDFYTGEIFEELPYYGEVLDRHVMPGSGDPGDPVELRVGKVTNPTVHICMNQLRKVVNELIGKYGHPVQIHVEVTRDLKLPIRVQREIEREQTQNQQRNEEFAERLRELGLPDNYDNRLKLRLWEELNADDPLDRRCPFSGELISISQLFSPHIEIEHILPFARSLDDSIANKTLATRGANRDKENRSPFEAFGDSPVGYDWEEVSQRALLLPPNKRWRFQPNAMEKLAEDGDFLNRHLNDTAYISTLAKSYLSAICPPRQIMAIPGRLTGLLRHHWGLNSILGGGDVKSRDDHRHHAIDAIVVGLTDRSTLQRISTANSRDFVATDDVKVPDPIHAVHEKVTQVVTKIAVSHRPDHGINAQLHNDTAYRIDQDADGRPLAVSRKALDSLKPNQLQHIRDAVIREGIIQATAGKTGKEYTAAIKAFSVGTGIKRVRISEPLNLIPVSDSRGQVYKGYKGDANYCMEIWENEAGKWTGNLVTRFEANQQAYREFRADTPRFRTETFDGKPLVMRLIVDDTLAVGEGKERRLLRVVKMSGQTIVLAEINESGALKARDADKHDPFKYISKSPNSLKSVDARRVFIDPIGRVFDPGAK